MLDDPDEQVFEAVQKKILSYGKEILPVLEQAKDNINDVATWQKIEELQLQLQFASLLQALTQWKNEPKPSLLEGLLLIDGYHYSTPDTDYSRRQLKTIYQSMWLEVNNYMSPVEQVNVMVSIIYNMYKFNCYSVAETNTMQHYLQYVLHHKEGNVFSMVALWIILANMLDIPIAAVRVHDQYLLAYYDELYLNAGNREKGKILFYIDVHTSMLYTQHDVDAYLKKMNAFDMNTRVPKLFSTIEVMMLHVKHLMKCYQSKALINTHEKNMLALLDMLQGKL